MQIVINIDEKIYASVMDGTYCGTLYQELKNGVPLPKGHGRLIDADAINLKDISPVDGFSVYGATAEDIDLAPTVLEAESEAQDADSN